MLNLIRGYWGKSSKVGSEEIPAIRSDFHRLLDEAKRQVSEVGFYPYGTWGNLFLIDKLLADGDYDIESLLSVGNINDVGGGDGDLAFYCKALGADRVSLIDFSHTNFNRLGGAQVLKKRLNLDVNIIDVNLEFGNSWDIVPFADLTLFLGLMYHLENPERALVQLAQKTKYMFLSTKIFDLVSSLDIRSYPVAYFYSPGECNSDATNWWCFTETCLKKMFERTGWEVLSYKRFGDKNSDPIDMSKDGRAFAFLKSRKFN